MNFIRHKKKESLSELQGVPDGTFRCDVCRFVQPSICLCGTVIDAVDDLPPKKEPSCNVRLELKIKGVNHGQEIAFSGADHQQAESPAFRLLTIMDEYTSKNVNNKDYVK